MNAMRCDRCGKFFTINDMPPYIPNITPEFRSGVQLDLCTECIDSFNEWLHTDFYFSEQVKMGHAIPLTQQSCGKCVFWKFVSRQDGCQCSLGRNWRDTDTVCDKWKPDKQ